MDEPVNTSDIEENAHEAKVFNLARGINQSRGTTRLNTVVERVREITGASLAGVASFSRTEKTFSWLAISGTKVNSSKESSQQITDNFYQKLLSETGLIVLKHDSPFISGTPFYSPKKKYDMALVPLRARDALIGLLLIGFPSPHSFTKEEKQLIEALTDMAALALDNILLIEIVGAAKRVWEQTFDAIPDGVIVHDQNMRITRCNARAADSMDMSPAEVIGLSCTDAFARLFGERTAAYHMKETTGTTSSFELQAEDSRRYLVSISPLQGISEQPWGVLTWSDVTELSEMQEQMSRSRRLSTLGQLADGVAHEINNPLAAITICAESMLRDINESKELSSLADESDWRFFLEEIVKQTLRCKTITRGLVDMSRNRKAARIACNINELVIQSVNTYEGKRENVEIAVELDPELGLIATDEGMIRQILGHLLSNALNAIEDKGSITVSTARDGDRIVVEVADSGCGISPALLSRIFDPFFTTKETGQGAGLGLAISAMLAESMGGTITVRSKQGEGSRFKLWIPRRVPVLDQ
jgi:two-component system, NtrC family, sensor kinase